MQKFNNLNCLENSLAHVGFHTGNGTTSRVIDLGKADQEKSIELCSIRKVRSKDEKETYLRVNPNKNTHGNVMTKFSEFQKVTQDMFGKLGITDFKWKRLDMSISYVDDKYYTDYSKLYRLLIACIANSAKDKNSYDTKDFWTNKTQSLATKNQQREVEFYDKKAESQNKSPYCSRLELRSLRINGDIEHEFKVVWFKRLDNAVKQFEAIQDRFNECLAEIYKEDLKKKEQDREFMNINSFLLAKRDYIFTRKQMKKLLILIGLSKEKAQYKVYNFNRKRLIEYYSQDDLKVIVADTKAKITEYFSR